MKSRNWARYALLAIFPFILSSCKDEYVPKAEFESWKKNQEQSKQIEQKEWKERQDYLADLEMRNRVAEKRLERIAETHDRIFDKRAAIAERSVYLITKLEKNGWNYYTARKRGDRVSGSRYWEIAQEILSEIAALKVQAVGYFHENGLAAMKNIYDAHSIWDQIYLRIPDNELTEKEISEKSKEALDLVVSNLEFIGTPIRTRAAVGEDKGAAKPEEVAVKSQEDETKAKLKSQEDETKGKNPDAITGGSTFMIDQKFRDDLMNRDGLMKMFNSGSGVQKLSER